MARRSVHRSAEETDEDSIFEEQDEEFTRRVERRNRRDEVDKVVKFMIKASQSEKGYAVDTDLRELLKDQDAGRNMRQQKSHRLDIVQEASLHMRNTLGVEIITDEDLKPARYYLRNVPEDQLTEELKAIVHERHQSKSREDKYKDGVLYTALMFIFMHKKHSVVGPGSGVLRSVLEKFLTNVFGMQTDRFNDLFGPVKSAEFVKKGYIKVTIVQEKDDTTVESYDWGLRAEKVVDKKTILINFCEIYGSKIWAWPKHAEAAGVDSRELERMRKAAEQRHLDMLEDRRTEEGEGTTEHGSGDEDEPMD